MTMGLVGRKCGMTRVFTDDGDSIPVTVIEAQPNRVTQVKTEDRDGYRALQVAAGARKASRVAKPVAGHFAAAKVEAGEQTAATLEAGRVALLAERDRLADGAEGVQWTHWSDAREVYGVDSEGWARQTWDNEGVQYGLRAVANQEITPAEFLRLNAHNVLI